MWNNPHSTMFNWNGMFKERTFLQKLLGAKKWRDGQGTALKESLSEFLWGWIERNALVDGQKIADEFYSQAVQHQTKGMLINLINNSNDEQ